MRQQSQLLETSSRPEGSRRTTDAVHRPPGGATHLFHRPLLLRFPGCLLLPQSSLISRPTSMLPGKTLPLSKCCQHQSISPLPPKERKQIQLQIIFLCTIVHNTITLTNLHKYLWSILYLLILVHHPTIQASKKYAKKGVNWREIGPNWPKQAKIAYYLC